MSDAQSNSDGMTKPNSPMFVGWDPSVESPPKKSAPRLHHKKSRTGCQQCRARRVKCNEVHPVCGSCQRHQTTCVWGRPTTSKSDPKGKTYEIRPKIRSQSPPRKPDIIALPESTERRILELRLLHQYMASTALSVNVKADPMQKEWSVAVPQLAFKNNSLLYSIYTLAALHIAKLEPNIPENMDIYQRYLGLTLREHRNDVSTLSRANADAACLTSTYLRICTFALLQERTPNPYSPPIEWLQMGCSTGKGLSVAAWKYIADDETSIMRKMILNAPGLKAADGLRDDDQLFRAHNRTDLQYLLRRTPKDIDEEPWNPKIQAAYESTISYIGSIQLAVIANESAGTLFRRLTLFPTMVEEDFIQLVIERRPRALVVLAHFFAFLTDFREFWWIGDTGPREVRGIESVLPEEWLDLMNWPLQAVEDVYMQAF